MAASVLNFSSQLPRQATCFRPRAELMHGSSLLTNSSQLMQTNKKVNKRGICMRRKMDNNNNNKPFNRRRPNLVKSLADEMEVPLDHPPSASSMIKQLYKCINEKKLKEIEHYISDDCCYDDCSFPFPIQGRKEVMRFFQQLTAGMGHNVKFIIEHVCEDQTLTTGVNWHLEWKKTPLPFTRGCSFYECSQDGNKLVIKKALVIIESPIKPGGIVLTLLKNVTGIFDDFPKAAEWVLRSPHVILQLLFKIYTSVLAPFINPIIGSYIKMWNFMARFFFIALNTLLHILKHYFG